MQSCGGNAKDDLSSERARINTWELITMLMLKLDRSSNVREQNFECWHEAMFVQQENLWCGCWRDAHEGDTSKVTWFPLCRKLLKRGAERIVRWRTDKQREARVSACRVKAHLERDNRLSEARNQTHEQSMETWRWQRFLIHAEVLADATPSVKNILTQCGRNIKYGRDRRNDRGRGMCNSYLNRIRMYEHPYTS